MTTTVFGSVRGYGCVVLLRFIRIFIANGTSSGCVVHHVTILSNFVKSSAMEAISIKSSSTIAGSLIVGILRSACTEWLPGDEAPIPL